MRLLSSTLIALHLFYVAPALRPHHDYLFNLINYYCGDVINERQRTTITFQPLEYSDPNRNSCKNPVIGRCYLDDQRMRIEIDPTYWKEASPTVRLILLAHEESHCFLSVVHSYDRDNYMYPALPEQESYIHFYEQFISVLKDCNGRK